MCSDKGLFEVYSTNYIVLLTTTNNNNDYEIQIRIVFSISLSLSSQVEFWNGFPKLWLFHGNEVRVTNWWSFSQSCLPKHKFEFEDLNITLRFITRPILSLSFKIYLSIILPHKLFLYTPYDLTLKKSLFYLLSLSIKL